MFRTKNDLPEATRAAMVALLNQRLSDCIDLQLQSKQAHWNVKGPQFRQLHELFDDVAGAVEEYIDLIAERVTQLGGTAEGTVQAVSERSRLPAYPMEIAAGADHVEALSTALAAFGRETRRAIDQASERGDAGTADVFTEVTLGIDKWLWFVEAHAQAPDRDPTRDLAGAGRS